MKLTGTYTLPAPREQVFAAVTDPAVLQRCLSGCERMVLTGPDAYDAHLKIGVAGLKGDYVGKVQLRDKQPPESYALAIEGRGKPGFVQGTARIRLADRAGQTELHCDADVQVGGVIAAIGSRLIEATAKKLMAEFFRKLGDQVRAAAP
jgi:hypothetical protein